MLSLQESNYPHRETGDCYLHFWLKKLKLGIKWMSRARIQSPGNLTPQPGLTQLPYYAASIISYKSEQPASRGLGTGTQPAGDLEEKALLYLRTEAPFNVYLLL